MGCAARVLRAQVRSDFEGVCWGLVGREAGEWGGVRAQVRSDFEVTCFAYEGIDAIKAALLKGIQVYIYAYIYI